MLTNFGAGRRVAVPGPTTRMPHLRDVLPTLAALDHATGSARRMATVVTVDRSAPREPGSVMAVSETGEVVGLGDRGVRRAGGLPAGRGGAGRRRRPRMATYGYADDEAFEVGLPCGGNVGIFVEPMEPAPGGARSPPPCATSARSPT